MYGPYGLQVLGIDLAEDAATVINWASNLGLTYPLLLDQNYSVWNQYGMGFIPHNVLIDTSMVILYTYYGYDEQQLINLINNYYAPLYAENITLSSPFMRLNLDTLSIRSHLVNPENHNVSMKAMITSTDSAYQDSIPMFDDGQHDDSLAGDLIFGGYLPPLSVENDFTVGVKTTDLDFNVEIMTDERARFTTKGPVGFVSHYFFGSDTIPNAGDRLFMKITLRNDGAVATAENVAAFLSSPNSCVTITASNNNYGNIAPGANATIAGHYMIRFDNSCGTNTTIPIDLEISSNSYVYWNDSFSITLDPVGIPANSDKLPDKFALYQNYPNPFNPATAIQFALPGTEHVKLQIYNMAGQLIKTLINKKLQAGYHEAIWDGREQNGTKVASGIYFYKFTAGSFTKVRKMMYLK